MADLDVVKGEFVQGIIIRGYGGFYIVEAAGVMYTCSLRGKLHKDKNVRITIGDAVLLTPLGNGEGVVEQILPRKTELLRPRIANVDQCLILFAADDPAVDWMLLDRLLLLTQLAKISPVLCFNKADLNPEIEQQAAIYRQAGFTVFVTSVAEGRGIDQLIAQLTDKITVLAGPSGAGKSSTLNMLKPELALNVGEISQKSSRGKHTTRYVELWRLGNGAYVADSPGFSRLDLPPQLKARDLGNYYPEFHEPARECRFESCVHAKEQECGVKDALAAGKIDAERYRRYLFFLEELQQREENLYD